MTDESPRGWLDSTPSRAAFILGLLLGLALAFIVGFFILLNILLSGGKLAIARAPANANAPTAAGRTAEAPSPSAPVNVTVSDKDHITGPKNAKVTIVEYSDFQCPFCGRFHPTLQRILSEYGNQVRLVYRHFPLESIHKWARPAAEASECASEQGKFWEYHDALFDNQDKLGNDLFPKLAGDLKLDTKKFNDCLTSGKYKQVVDNDYQQGITDGVQGTPHSIINGTPVSGAQPYESVKALIDQILKG